MHNNYHDITSRIADQPVWWDSNGVPRYDEFTPAACPDIYSCAVALLTITCQDCGQAFNVEMHLPVISDRPFVPRRWHYGDPPNHGCVGDSMNCVDSVVIEAWDRSGGPLRLEWVRRPDLEGKSF